MSLMFCGTPIFYNVMIIASMSYVSYASYWILSTIPVT